MTQAELLGYLVDTLPRFTQDIDVVVALTAPVLADFLRRFPASEFYVSADAARDALARRGQVNIIHGASGVKIDVFLGKDTAYDRLRFERRQRLPLVAGRDAHFARPEDVILYKLLYFRDGGSDPHLRDIAAMLDVSRADIDVEYLERWAHRLGIGALWESTRGGAGES